MNRELVGEPGVSAFLQSVRQNLGDVISRIKPANTTPIFYDPSNNLKSLKEKLASLRDVLVDGEARRLDEESVDEWMDDIKHLLYDVEDILDDSRGLSDDQVRTHELYITSHELKRRLEEILVRTDVSVVKAKDLELKRGSGYASWGNFQAIRRRPETSAIVDMSDIHGRKEDQRVIVERLFVANDKVTKNYDVLCIVGMGGLGKTTLAQLVFNDPKVEKHFDVKSWVCISDVFDVGRATKELIENSVGGGSAGDQQSLSGLQTRLKQMVGNKRFLFVLDDVWSSSEWEKMKAPFSSCANGSKILVTTRNTNIAHALGNKKPYQLQRLHHEQCMTIFNDKAFGEDERELEKLNLGEKIVKACRGVPLAVKVIGSMLHGAEEEKWRAVSKKAALWDAAYIKNDEIHPAIRLSYHYLPAFLKRCFEYLAIFPPDYEFEQDYVVRLWIADGLVQEVDNRMLEDIGNEYYNELKARSLIQEDDTMHDIVQHFATDVSSKFCYKENSNEPLGSVRHAFLVHPNAMHKEFLAQASLLRTLIFKGVKDELHVLDQTKVLRTLRIHSSLGESSIGHLTHLRYLSITYSDFRHLPNSLCMLGNLQFLDLSGNKHLENLPEKMDCLSNLRFLNLEGSSIVSLPDSICSLSQLQFLNLYRCQGLKQLPKDIGNLRSLRKLHLQKTYILCVPESIAKVTGLQNLLVDKHDQLPLHFGRLTRLKELPNFRVGTEEGRRLGELNLMNRLEGRLNISCMENIGSVEEAKMADLKSKKFLEGLEFCWSEPGNDHEMEVKIMEALEPHHALYSLKFLNYGGDKFPAWIMSRNIFVSNLAYLEMKGLNKIFEMVDMEFVSNLAYLEMKGLNKIFEMVDMEFVSLKTLRIIDCPRLTKVLMATPNLRGLVMRKCGELEADSVHLLPSLSDKDRMYSIVSQLEFLWWDYNIFEYFFEKLKTENLKWGNLTRISLEAGGRKVASLPGGWPSMMESLWSMDLYDIGPGNFQFLPEGDQNDFPPSLAYLFINNCWILERLLHHSYIINSDGKVDMEEESGNTGCRTR